MFEEYQYILDDNGLDWVISGVIHTISKEILLCRYIVNEQVSDRIVIYDIKSGKLDYIGLVLGFSF